MCEVWKLIIKKQVVYWIEVTKLESKKISTILGFLESVMSPSLDKVILGQHLTLSHGNTIKFIALDFQIDFLF